MVGARVNGDSERPRRRRWLARASAVAASGEGPSTNPKLPNQLHVSVRGGVGSVVEGTRGPVESRQQLAGSHGTR
jgi:hypothetical protein